MLAYTKYISAAISGEYSVEEALKRANDDIYIIMKDAGYYN
jgi:hypothetical protein